MTMKQQREKTGGFEGAPTHFDPGGVFVVRFHASAGPREASGRVECVSSGKRVSFASADELMAFMLGRIPGGGDPDRGC